MVASSEGDGAGVGAAVGSAEAAETAPPTATLRTSMPLAAMLAIASRAISRLLFAIPRLLLAPRNMTSTVVDQLGIDQGRGTPPTVD